MPILAALSHDEAMVLFDLLQRWAERERLGEPEHKAEWITLWNLSSRLESMPAEVLHPAKSSRTRMQLIADHGTVGEP